MERCLSIRERLIDELVDIRDDVYSQWRISPEPFFIDEPELLLIESLGRDLHSFYKASNKLYYESIHGRQPGWIARYLNQGKPRSLIEYACMNRIKGLLPGVIRPDIILTEGGMVATELDSVPGGMGITDNLNKVYSDHGFTVVGEKDGMSQGFLNMLKSVTQMPDPMIAIVVSEESKDYRPEMEWLAGAIKDLGGRALAVKPGELIFTEEGLYLDKSPLPTPLHILPPQGGGGKRWGGVLQGERDRACPRSIYRGVRGEQGFSGEKGGRLRVDVVYRFFELFDLKNIPKVELIMYSAKKKEVAVTPPFKPFLEEKMLYALFHHPMLEGYWRRELGEDVCSKLRNIFPRTWILDPAEMPPYGIIPGLKVGRRAVSRWTELAEATQTERAFVIKPSGFSELAWGSRGVVIGDDVSKEEWGEAIDRALKNFDRTPYILQEYHKGRHVEIMYLDENTPSPHPPPYPPPTRGGRKKVGGCFAGGEGWSEGVSSIKKMTGRVRLCPYYFVEGEDVRLRGIMATICPLDKKLIHGMRDAVITVVEMR
ncbi:MAG: hypothetical protein HZA12_05100 [Nitrospirae bacterium]|nr:hypothetical protein [Nitrospirota bacterium]